MSRINRRAFVQLVVASAAAAARVEGEAPQMRKGTRPRGTPTDPVLIDPLRPWPLTLSEADRRAVAVLCDLIMPADARSPAATALKAHEFVDEWVSALYPEQQGDAGVLHAGLAWLEGESRRRHERSFADLGSPQQRAICDDICSLRHAAPEALAGADMFSLVRALTGAAVWTTQEGMDDLGYIGNTPLSSWGPPPGEVLRHLGLGRDDV